MDRIQILIGLVGSCSFFLAVLCLLLARHACRVGNELYQINQRLARAFQEMGCPIYLGEAAEPLPLSGTALNNCYAHNTPEQAAHSNTSSPVSAVEQDLLLASIAAITVAAS